MFYLEGDGEHGVITGLSWDEIMRLRQQKPGDVPCTTWKLCLRLRNVYIHLHREVLDIMWLFREKS